MEKYKAKMGNISCILQEFKMIDQDMELDLEGMLKDSDTYGIKDEWLLEKNKKLTRLCYAVINNTILSHVLFLITCFWYFRWLRAFPERS